MTDLLYLLGTVVFFGLMLRYVSFCERLGRSAAAENADAGPRP